MKKRVKILILIFILSLFAVLLSGCNSFGGNDGGVTSESSTEEIELKNDPILLNGDTPYCIVRASKADKEGHKRRIGALQPSRGDCRTLGDKNNR